ncbi:F-box only protein 36 [Lamellibrachia satsuma]|nr:F-box only protein 36 [Lamellibrachia satsuma]
MGEDTRNARLMVALNGVGTAYFDPRPAVVKFLETARRCGAPDWDIYGQTTEANTKMALHCKDLFPKGVILNEAAVAPPPCKDYHQIFITTEQIIFRWWKISLRSDAKVAPPGEIILSHEDFLSDDRTQSDISHAFGDNMVDYVIRIAEVSRLFHGICESNELWEKIYRQHSVTMVTRELETLANAIGWKKLFFTNKLQVQVQLLRTRQKTGQDWMPMVNSASDWSDDVELNSDFDLK